MRILRFLLVSLSGMAPGKSQHLLVFPALLLASVAYAQNPSFAGKEFKRIWVDGTVPPRASGSPRIGHTYMTPAGVYMSSTLFVTGVFFLDDSGVHTVALQSDFDPTQRFHFLGAKPDGSAIIIPVAINNPHPCQLYDAGGLSPVTSPTPEQGINLSNYFDGRMVYLTASGQGGSKIWYYEEGQPAQLWYDNTSIPGLNTIVDYDGASLAFSVGGSGGDDLWLRKPDGTASRMIGFGDTMPGEPTTTFTSAISSPVVEVDQGKVYVMGVGAGSSTRVLFSTSDGSSYDIIAKRYDPIPGLGGITISDMNLKQVQNGKIWLLVNQSDGDKVLFRIENGVWSRVAGQNDTYDGRVGVGFEVFEHSMLGDRVVIAVSFPSSSWPYSTSDLYVNADLPGLAAGPSGLPMQIVRQLNGNLTISATGEPGETNTLQGISSLTNTAWQSVGTVIADGSGLMQWTMSPTNTARFFRLVE